MRRIVVTALLLGLAGCGVDDDLGIPKDVTPAKPPVDMSKKLEIMKGVAKSKGKISTPAEPVEKK